MADPRFAYTPVVPQGEERVKRPAWLNEPIYYHNRGNSDWVGESSHYGDFSGLDDLATQNPRVVQGFIHIYGKRNARFDIDGLHSSKDSAGGKGGGSQCSFAWCRYPCIN